MHTGFDSTSKTTFYLLLYFFFVYIFFNFYIHFFIIIMTSKTCAGCLQVIKNRLFLCCCVCNSYYDLLCANVSEQRFRNTLTGEHRLSWKCASCVCREPKVNNSDTPVRGNDDKVTRHRGAAIHSPVECNSPDMALSPIKRNSTETVQESSNGALEALAGRLDTLVSEIRIFRQEMTDTCRQVQAFDEKLSGLVTQVETCVSEVKDLRARVEKLENGANTSNLENTIESLKAELNERDQELLLNDVEFTCIPENKGEGRVPLWCGWCDALCATTCCGLPAYAALLPTEGVDLLGPPNRFYINERLTRANRVLFRQAREVAGRLGWRFVWTRDGKIFARQRLEQDAPRHRLRSQADLARVFGPSAVGSHGIAPAFK
ncbi:hypothetical protein ACJJTC_010886 [Scirpophaga incertulas]